MSGPVLLCGFAIPNMLHGDPKTYVPIPEQEYASFDLRSVLEWLGINLSGYASSSGSGSGSDDDDEDRFSI